MIINQEEFRQELISDWENDFYNKHKDFYKDTNFIKLNEIRQLYGIYELFFPLGIQKNNLTDTCHVFAEIKYACDDDGDLSVVLCNLSHSSKMNVITKKEIFVMHGWHNDLTKDMVEKFAFYHGKHYNFLSFEAVRFTYKVLDIFLSMKDKITLRNNLQNKLCCLNDIESLLQYNALQDEITNKLWEDIKTK